MPRHSSLALAVFFSTSALLLAQKPSPSTPKSATERARAVLAAGAADNEPEVRREVAVAFSLSRSTDPSFATLQLLLADKDYLCREAAIATVGQLGDPKLAPLVRPALQDDVPEVMFAAARALQQLGDPDGARALVEIIDREHKAESSMFRGKLRDVARRLKTPKSVLLFATEQGIGFAPVPGLGEGYSALTAMLTDVEFSPRAAALLSLASIRSAESRKMVDQAFSDDDWSMRAAAIQMMASWNDRPWRVRLVPLLADSNKKVRFRAAAVYLRLTDSGRSTSSK